MGSSPAVITSALNNSWAPIVYRADEADRSAVLAHTARDIATLTALISGGVARSAVLAHTARDIATLTALISGGVALLSPWLMRIAADESFQPLELVPAVAIVAFGCVLSVAYLANVHLVFAVGHSLWLSVITPLSLLIGLAGAYLVGRQNPVLLAVGFPATYLTLAAGTAWLRRHLRAVSWSEAALLLPAGLGLVLCTLGGLLPTSGTAALVRVAVAALTGFGTLRLARRILR